MTAGFGVLVAGSGTAAGALVMTTDRAAFVAGTPGAAVVELASLPTASYGTALSAGQVRLGRLTLSATGTAVADSDVQLAGGRLMAAIAEPPNVGLHALTIHLPEPTTRFGFTLRLLSSPSPVGVLTTVLGEPMPLPLDPSTPGFPETFVGLISSTPFTSVTFTPDLSLFPVSVLTVSNLTLPGAAIPDPSATAAALPVALLLRRRRR